ncbi:hypothetical protein L6164_003626 [Bauhinia variegata]|nr:hypothetical protein L6164_003626 [Bauhinia variegata]
MHKTVIKGSYDGWFVTVGIDGEIQMLNPFSKDQISLPPMSTLPSVIAYHPEKHNEEYTITARLYRIGPDFRLVTSKSVMQQSHIKKVIISSSPGIMAMIIYGFCGKLAYCKFGDKEWTGIGTDPKLVIGMLYLTEERSML